MAARQKSSIYRNMLHVQNIYVKTFRNGLRKDLMIKWRLTTMKNQCDSQNTTSYGEQKEAMLKDEMTSAFPMLPTPPKVQRSTNTGKARKLAPSHSAVWRMTLVQVPKPSVAITVNKVIRAIKQNLTIWTKSQSQTLQPVPEQNGRRRRLRSSDADDRNKQLNINERRPPEGTVPMHL
jgi:hypothetical protein